jgi:hypothetical protein
MHPDRKGIENHLTNSHERGENIMAYSDKVVDHYENPRNVGTLDKSRPKSAPAWSARRSAAM